MNRQDVMTLIGRADPVPEVDNLPSVAWSNTELLHVIDERRHQVRDLMEPTDLERTTHPTRWRMPLLAAIATFVLVIAAVGIVTLVTDGDDPLEAAATPTTTPTPTTSLPTTTLPPATTVAPLSVGPVELTVEQESLIAVYLDARNGSSWDEYIALFAPGATRLTSNETNPAGVGTLEKEIERFRFLAATGFESEELRCQQYPPRVVCTFLVSEIGTEAFNLSPWQLVKTFEFDDAGLITYFKADTTQFPRAAWERFGEWVGDTHPEQRHLLDAAGREFNFDTDPTIALELVQEYGAYLDSK